MGASICDGLLRPAESPEESQHVTARGALFVLRHQLPKILPFDEKAALEGARIRAHLERQGNRIGDLDSLISAHAFSLNLVMVTNNLREFSWVPGLRTENWVLPAETQVG